MIIDCDSCAVRGTGCSDCVISVLLDAPPTVELEEPELRAIDTLANAGLVPRLRLVTKPDAETPQPAERSAERSDTAARRRHRQVG